MSPNWRRRWALILVAMFVAWTAVTARVFVWPDLPPLPESVDAIVVLDGPGRRDAAAMALTRQGRARNLVQFTSADEMPYRHCSVPDMSVWCFQPDPETTRGEARTVADLARQHGWRSLILVTTPDQAWRAKVRVGRCFDGEIFVATAELPWYRWPYQIPYQWAATAKALTYERSC